MTKLRVACSPLTAHIYIGKINKTGDSWLGKPAKVEVTGDACAAVAQHVIMQGGSTVVTANGIPKYEIIVKEILA